MDIDRAGLQLLVALSAAVCFATMLFSRRSAGAWLLNPAGPFALLLFIQTTGTPIYYLRHDELPAMFGLEPHLVGRATWAMIIGQIGLFVGIAVAKLRHEPAATGRLLEGSRSDIFLGLLKYAAAITSVPVWIPIATLGLRSVTSSQYGESVALETSNWTEHYATFSNVAFVAVPTFVLFLIASSIGSRKLLTPGNVLVGVIVAFPPLLTGGRRDLVGITAGLVIAVTIRRARLRTTSIVLGALLVVAISYLVQISRSGLSLSAADRLQALSQTETSADDVVDYSLLLATGTYIMTAVMSIYPSFMPHTYGTSYLQAARNVLQPGFLWGGYPYKPMAWQFREVYYPDTRNFGLDYGLQAEAYQNFGMLGPGLVLALIGFSLYVLYRYAAIARTRPTVWCLVHIQFLTTAGYGLRTDSNGLFKALTYGILWILAIWALAGLVDRRLQRASEPQRLVSPPGLRRGS